MMKKHGKLITGAMMAAMLFVLPTAPAWAAKLPGAQYSAVQLKAVQTKEVTYYKTGSASIPSSIEWTTDTSVLKFLPLSVLGDVTSVVLDEDGVYWIGTENGLQRVDFSAEDTKDIVQYMAGPRYLYGGDDNVTALASDGEGGIWARTASGVTHIAMPEKTLHEKSFVYEDLVQSILDRRGMVHDTNFTFTETDSSFDAVNYNSPTGKFTSTPSTSDNDGLWTTMYAMGEVFRYKALQEEYGASPAADQVAEIAEAKAAALRATKAVLLLDYVSGRGNGFPARSYMLTSEAGAATVGNSVYGYQSQNGFWFQNFVGPGMVNPNGIIPSMQRDDGVEPIGYSMVRVTKDAESKKGSTLFPSGGTDVMNYNGLGLSQEAIDELNKTRPEGQKLGTDIKTKVATSVTGAVYQVLPVITAATNNKDAKEDKTTGESNKPLFQLTAPVYEQIPEFFNDLFPASAIVNGHIDMNQIVYKADTSSDEVDGHYAMFYTAYKYLIGDSTDPELLELKSLIEETTHRMTELILKDDHYYIEDATGKSTQWSRWFSKYFNDSLGTMEQQVSWQSNVGVDENGDDALSYGYEDGPLNALEVMSALKVASYITAKSYPADSVKYDLAYEQAYNGSYSKDEPYVNGKGYMDMAKEYIERRLVRQATNAYDDNDNQVVTEANVGDSTNTNATLHNDWTQYINYSDEELGWFPVFVLITLEEDESKHAQIVEAYDQWYSNEVREENPFYTFLYQLAHPDKTDVDLESAVRFLYRFPEYQIQFPVQWNRQDVFYIEPGDRDDYKQTNYALAPDERRIIKNNSNPFESDNQTTGANPSYNYKSGNIEAGSVFTLPYWMGRYFEIIKE
ncbi:hypothetical protein KIH86_26985 [Paenibacillus sp. HN-1]|uniref:hypothetical protein n=2 Tax=Paenibacillus TaxID=44249 RepID=UPI001CA890F7|nr:hypothetical protein [Paenibacillus sp. CGMCC 1.18879]MBY9077568.1 hypothetical protein [Paenibacillus sp. CGMCC 1.18879]MBY9087839.1 hypothetical protein [Paenibacillus sinensis]